MLLLLPKLLRRAGQGVLLKLQLQLRRRAGRGLMEGLLLHRARRGRLECMLLQPLL